jgi:hypothetical protein
MEAHLGAFKAVYADWKLIKTRSTLQIVLEVPVNESDKAYRVLGGMPDPSTSVWVAVARLQDHADASSPPDTASATAEQGHSAPPSSTVASALPHKPRRFDAMPLSSQASMLCHEAPWWAYIRENWIGERQCYGEEGARQAIYRRYGITTRSQILAGTEVGRDFRRDRDAYLAWKRLAA